MNGALLRPLPCGEPDRLAAVWEVLPAGFVHPAPVANQIAAGTPDPELYAPRVIEAQGLSGLMGRFNHTVVARLRPGVTPAQAAGELSRIALGLVRLSGDDFQLRPSVARLQESMTGHAGKGLPVLWAAVGAVLLMAAVNLSKLTLAPADVPRLAEVRLG